MRSKSLKMGVKRDSPWIHSWRCSVPSAGRSIIEQEVTESRTRPRKCSRIQHQWDIQVYPSHCFFKGEIYSGKLQKQKPPQYEVYWNEASPPPLHVGVLQQLLRTWHRAGDASYTQQQNYNPLSYTNQPLHHMKTSLKPDGSDPIPRSGPEGSVCVYTQSTAGKAQNCFLWGQTPTEMHEAPPDHLTPPFIWIPLQDSRTSGQDSRGPVLQRMNPNLSLSRRLKTEWSRWITVIKVWVQ